MSARAQRLLFTSVIGLLSFITFSISEPCIEIVDVRTNSEQSFVTSDIAIRNRSRLDINFTVHQELIGHTVFVAIHLKAEVNGTLKTFKRWRNIDVCQFLCAKNRDPILNYIFENALHLQNQSFLSCPFKVGNYYIRDAYLDAKKLPPFVPKTKYRLFLEASQMMGDVAKLFSMKIDALYRDA